MFSSALFNLFTCAVIGRWLKMSGRDGEETGVRLLFKDDRRIFRWYTRKDEERWLTECLFADGSAFISSSWAGVEIAIRPSQEASSRHGGIASSTET